ncbi:MAG TPA: DNA primase [Rhodanobacteraceae bacterium]
MPGRIAQSFIDDLLTRLDIVEVVERRVPLKKAGREWTACCPFHNERTPSFTVSPQKQFYHCFGCGAHGTAVGFVMNYEHLEFPDAVEELAQAAGLEVIYERGQRDAHVEARNDLYALLDAAADFYQKQLADNPEGQAYCRERGLDADIVKAFRIGWAPAGWDGLLRQLGTSPARVTLLTQAGMLATGESGKTWDRFRERLMFPIFDRRGRVIAFGGRIVHKDQGPKYLNSPETPLFHKGRELFGLWQVKQASNTLDRLVVVEGYMDVAALHQAGLPIAVATLGTATTPEHAERLFRSTPSVVFCFDGDRAGRAAAWKALHAALPCLRDGRQASFLFLPDGDDPDSLVRREGRDGFSTRLNHATPLSDYLFDTLSADIDTHSLDGRARLAEQTRPLIARLPDGAFRELMAAELEKRTGVRAHLPATTQARQARPTTRTRDSQSPSLVRKAVTFLLAQPALAENLRPPHAFASFDKPGVELLVRMIDLVATQPGFNTASLLEHFREYPEYEFLAKLAMTPLPDSADLAHEFHGALAQMQRQARQQRLDALLERNAAGQLDAAGKTELRELLQSKAAR